MKKAEPIREYRRVGVFGLGRFGFGLAVRLSELGAEVLAVDSDTAKVEEIDTRVSRALALDLTNAFALKKADIPSLDLAILCIGRNIQSSLLATAVLQRLGAREIWVRAIDQSQSEILEAMGVSKIISIEKEMAYQVAQKIMLPEVRIIASITSNHLLAEVKVRPKFVGKTLRQLDFRRTHGVNVVAMRSRQTVKDPDGRERTEWILNDLPDADDVIREGDVLVVIGSDDSIVALQTEL